MRTRALLRAYGQLIDDVEPLIDLLAVSNYGLKPLDQEKMWGAFHTAVHSLVQAKRLRTTAENVARAKRKAAR